MKYMGSKNRIAKYILPIILENRANRQYYVEPFCGGCNLIDKVTGNRMANDINKYLIAMFKELSSGRYFSNIIERDYYNKVRNSHTNNTDEFSCAEKGWVGFMGSFNGRFFDGGYSGHLVGKRDYITEQIRNTLSQIQLLKDIEFTAGDYSEMIIPNNSIIYCDIPYKNTKQYSASKNFDYDKFYDWCVEMKDLGHTIFVSEYGMPPNFTCLWEMSVINSMHQKNTKIATEKLFTL